MADWKDDLRPGSFRGVSFKIKSHEFNGGRRKVDHEFPSKEAGNSEDLGKKLPGFNLDMYVIGDDYFSDRNALQEALDTEGPGRLIHPFLGEFEVQVGVYTLSETVEEGRMARFKVQFTKAGVPEFPAEQTDFFQSVINAVNDTLDFAQSALEVGMSVVTFPARVATAAADLVGSATDRVQKAAQTIGGGAQAIADVAYAIRNIKADAATLVRTPGLLAQRFRDAFDLLAEAVGEDGDQKGLARAISDNVSNFSPDPVVETGTPTSDRIAANQTAFQNFIVEIAIAHEAKAAIQGEYLSSQEAEEVRDEINEDIELQLVRVTSDDTYQSLRDLSVAINEGLPPDDVGSLVSYTPGKTLPALVIVHKMFGNIAKEEELVEHNGVRHPGFVPGGIEVEVSNA